MSKPKKKPVLKKEMIYAINVLINRVNEIEERTLMVSSLLHSYIECNEQVEKLKDYLQKTQETKAKEKEKENAS